MGKDAYNKSHYYGSGMILKQAIEKYGKENFKKEIIEHCEFNILDEREIYWIRELNSIAEGYNITEGGTGGDTFSENPNRENILRKHKGRIPPNKGIPMSEEQKKKCSEGQKKRFEYNPDAKYNNGSFKTGKDHVLYGKERDPEIVEKIRKSNLKTIKNKKRIRITVLATGISTEYNSISQAANATGLDKRTISCCATYYKSKISKKKHKIEFC